MPDSSDLRIEAWLILFPRDEHLNTGKWQIPGMHFNGPDVLGLPTAASLMPAATSVPVLIATPSGTPAP
jgi:hypothetical protein